MKRFLPFIFIAAFLFPVLGHAATAPVSVIKPTETTQTPAVVPIDINTLQIKGLLNSYTQLSNLTAQTQLAISQLSTNGFPTDGAQVELTAATASLDKAKLAITSFATTKSSVVTAQITIAAAKAHLLATLADLKALLPTLDTNSQS